MYRVYLALESSGAENDREVDLEPCICCTYRQDLLGRCDLECVDIFA